MIAVLVPNAAGHSKVAQLSGSLAVVLVCCAPKGFSLLICDATAWLSEGPDRFRKSASSIAPAMVGAPGESELASLLAAVLQTDLPGTQLYFRLPSHQSRASC